MGVAFQITVLQLVPTRIANGRHVGLEQQLSDGLVQLLLFLCPLLEFVWRQWSQPTLVHTLFWVHPFHCTVVKIKTDPTRAILHPRTEAYSTKVPFLVRRVDLELHHDDGSGKDECQIHIGLHVLRHVWNVRRHDIVRAGVFFFLTPFVGFDFCVRSCGSIVSAFHVVPQTRGTRIRWMVWTMWTLINPIALFVFF